MIDPLITAPIRPVIILALLLVSSFVVWVWVPRKKSVRFLSQVVFAALVFSPAISYCILGIVCIKLYD